MYPLTLNLIHKKVVVIGGGPVAAKRAKELIAAQSDLLIVASELCEELRNLIDMNQVKWENREYIFGDLKGAWLVQAATGNPATDLAIADEAEACQIWCVQASSSEFSSAWTPAVARGGDGILVAVSGGYDPGRAKAIRDAVAEGIETGQLPIRPTRIDPRPSIGSVHLVGGGPGSPGLLTVRGRHLLSLADVVVVDRLAPRAVLAHLSDEVEIIDCGKTPGNHLMTQDEINAVLINRAKQGLQVVRLKGGDPFIFGRGSEEALACQMNGIPFEVVPGVTSAASVPAAAGIPLTHRGVSRAFTVLTGHEGFHPDIKDLDQTYVVLMGVDQLERLTTTFIDAGWAKNTPVAIIERGWTSSQRTTVGILSGIAEQSVNENVMSPAVVVVGNVVNIRSQLGDLNGWQQ
jgi:uroporphyrin-III C-methyltransferase/precorrin-2 dehydrogenase/sirohydrochlorin ferrochelatase